MRKWMLIATLLVCGCVDVTPASKCKFKIGDKVTIEATQQEAVIVDLPDFNNPHEYNIA